MEKIIFGPVPSRRLGRSVGINNIPPKICSYSCVYCQIGRTLRMTVQRQSFYEPERIAREIEEKVRKLRALGENVDYLTFVPDGEPTLDSALGNTIRLLKSLQIKIAIITNASLLSNSKVRNDLAPADWVSEKIDSLNPETWKKINRPHGQLNLKAISDGILEFARTFKGTLVTETMLVRGVNDSPREIEEISTFIADLAPEMSYLAVPTRPPAESWVRPPEASQLNQAYQIFSQKSLAVELLIGYEGSSFVSTGRPEDDLLSITSVHPMRQEAVYKLLRMAGAGWEVVESLLNSGKLVETEYQGKKFYLRRF